MLSNMFLDFLILSDFHGQLQERRWMLVLHVKYTGNVITLSSSYTAFNKLLLYKCWCSSLLRECEEDEAAACSHEITDFFSGMVNE